MAGTQVHGGCDCKCHYWHDQKQVSKNSDYDVADTCCAGVGLVCLFYAQVHVAALQYRVCIRVIDNNTSIIKGIVQINRMTVWTEVEAARLAGDRFHLQGMNKRPALESGWGTA